MQQETTAIDTKRKTSQILWHYTSIENAIKILDTGIMRATHYSFLNDDEELHRGARIVFERFEEILKERNIEIPGKMDLYAKTRQAITKKIYDYGYIISFSKKGDCLPQWIGYTPKNGGCAIGFNKKLLTSAFTQKITINSNNDEKTFEPIAGVRSCIYVDDDYSQIDAVMKKDFHILLVTIENAIKKFKDKNYGGPRDYIIKLWEQGLCLGLLDFMARIKNTSFSYENECRLVFSHSGDFGSPQFDGMKPFFECKMNKKIYQNLIMEIKISPHGNQSNAFKSLDFLRTKILDDLQLDFESNFFPISKSKLSYRS